MLATLVPEPFYKPGWVYEEKYDGDRLLAYKEGSMSGSYPEMAKIGQAGSRGLQLPFGLFDPVTFLLDGEAVVFDRKRVSRFQLLQQEQRRAGLCRL